MPLLGVSAYVVTGIVLWIATLVLIAWFLVIAVRFMKLFAWHELHQLSLADRRILIERKDFRRLLRIARKLLPYRDIREHIDEVLHEAAALEEEQAGKDRAPGARQEDRNPYP